MLPIRRVASCALFNCTCAVASASAAVPAFGFGSCGVAFGRSVVSLQVRAAHVRIPDFAFLSPDLGVRAPPPPLRVYAFNVWANHLNESPPQHTTHAHTLQPIEMFVHKYIYFFSE